MDLETFIIATYCLIDEAVETVLAGQRLRQRGPMPTLADSEVLTIEAVGEFLGLDQDTAIYDHFRRHHADLFPVLPRIARPSSARPPISGALRSASGNWCWRRRRTTPR